MNMNEFFKGIVIGQLSWATTSSSCLLCSVCMCCSLWSRTLQQRRSSPSWPREISLGFPWRYTPRQCLNLGTGKTLLQNRITFGLFVICDCNYTMDAYMFREFVIYNNDQFYAKYFRWYKRIHGKGELEVRLRLLRLCIRTQPYYWCGHLRYRLLRSRMYWIASQSFCLLHRR